MRDGRVIAASLAKITCGLGIALLALSACIAPPITGDGSSERLVARRVDQPPRLSDALDPAWLQAQLLRLPLTWGSHGTEHALDVELAALYTTDTLYLRARWPDAAPSGPVESTENKLTVHWRIPPEPGQPAPACDVACHTATADGAGDLAYINAETIPQGGDATLPSAGGWRDGWWTVTWSRPLRSPNLYDLQFTDLARPYRFFVKVFQEQGGRPDPVSELHELVFEP